MSAITLASAMKNRAETRPRTENVKRARSVAPSVVLRNLQEIPAEHSVCSMCAKTRGVSIKLVPESASRVCRACTFHNKDGSHVCEMCGKTLRLDTAESTV